MWGRRKLAWAESPWVHRVWGALLEQEAKDGWIWEHGNMEPGLGTRPARGLWPLRGDVRCTSPKFRRESARSHLTGNDGI